MDPKLLQLLVGLGLVAEQDATALDDLTALSADELMAVRGAIGNALDTIRADADAGGTTDAQLQLAASGAAAYKALNAELDRRRSDDDQRSTMVGELIASVLGPRDEPAPAPPSPSRPALPRISTLAGRQPRSARPILRGGPRVLTAAGVPVTEDIVAHFNRAMQTALSGPNEGDRQMVTLAQLEVDYPAERTLTEDPDGNHEKLVAAAGPAAMLASGGICGPTTADYSIQSIATADRPVRDAMVAFGATRGGFRYWLPATLGTVHAAAPSSVWTQATDAAPGNSTKPHAVYTCPSVLEALVDAVTSIVEFGNFNLRFTPEATSQFLDTAAADHARLAESTLLKAISDGSTKTVAGVDLLGATREFLPAVDRAAAALRYRNRLPREFPLTIIYPELLEDLIRSDLARQLPGDSGGGRERLAVTDAEIDSWFAVRSITTVKTLDSPTGAANLQGFVAQGAGDLLPWPDKAMCWLFPAGSWTFADGGTLALGVVRDSVLSATNRAQVWSESFEKAVFRGVESLEITVATCPSGATAGTQDSTGYCLSGS